MESRETGPLRLRAFLLGAGAVLSLAAIVWAAGRQSPEAVQAGRNDRSAEAEDHHDEPTVLGDAGRFTGPGGEWPPQPKGATDIVRRSDLALAPIAPDDRLRRLDTAAGPADAPSRALEADVDVSAALGDRHNLIAVEQTDGGARLVYYSLSTNQTVDVTVKDGAVAGLSLHRPEVFQPELSNNEKQAAVEIARAHWQSRGDARINTLEGFTILTLRPDGGYHDTRMVYVSFHVDEDSRPELLTWVDLVSGEVEKAQVDR